MKLKFKKTKPKAILPVYATQGSSGMDLHACIEGPQRIMPGEAARVPTGLAMELYEGLEAQIRPRSGLAARNAVTVLNAPGTIDSDFRGEIEVILINHSKVPFTVEPGMRIAQMVVMTAHVKCFPAFVDELDKTDRGYGGFGSTGNFDVVGDHIILPGRLHEKDLAVDIQFNGTDEFKHISIPSNIPYTEIMNKETPTTVAVMDELLNVATGKK